MGYSTGTQGPQLSLLQLAAKGKRQLSTAHLALVSADSGSSAPVVSSARFLSLRTGAQEHTSHWDL